MVDRDYIIKRIKSRGVTLGEFNFDRLQAPPLTYLLRPWEIKELEDISHSIRLSTQIQKKYQLIDGILRPRGFSKFINGTNRLCYEYIEDKSFMLKVAVDAVGCKDSPWEFKNQFIFKPFVPKVFEVSPGGSIGLFERVNPITNEEEFRAVAEDIYTVINEVFVGEYVLADIGTNFFMNWGIREGFGPVLLDFPYVYKLDGKKLFCNADDPYSETGVCNGTIDYDDGYNFLVCTKCGKHYKASALRCDGETRQIIIRENGGNKMKVNISGGNKDVSRTVIVNENGTVTDITNTMPVVNKENITKSTVETAPKIDKKEEEPVAEEPVVEEVKAEEPVVEEPKVAKNTFSVNGVSTPNVVKKDAVSPIKFVTEEDQMQAMENILNHINEIRSLSGLLKPDETFDLCEMLLDLTTELENRPNAVKPNVTSYTKCSKKCALILDKLNEEERFEALDDGFTKEIVDAYNELNTKGTEEEPVAEDTEEVEEPVVEEDYDEEDSELDINGFALVSATVQNMKDIDPGMPSKKVIVILDDSENYILSSNREIMAIDTVDNRSVDSISIVSEEWLDKVQKLLNSENSADDIMDDQDDDLVDMVDTK